MVILCAPGAKKTRTASLALRLATVLLFVAVFFYQASWQLGGHANRQFVQFLRRYNKRPNAAELQVQRAPILDRNGLILAAPVPGNVWGRRYPLGEAAVHPLGYFHPSSGLTAVERVADPLLSGYARENTLLRAKEIFSGRAEEGSAITLTLDSRLQKQAYDLLAGRKGAVIILIPHTGDLLALVSAPGFNPNAPIDAMSDTENLPAFNRAVSGRYPPGSTFKILTAGLALTKGIRPRLPCPAHGYYVNASTPAIRDSEYYSFARRGQEWPGWGTLDMKEAMAHSSNVYFAQLGTRCDVADFNDLMVRARINESLTYFSIQGAALQTAKGNVPTVKKKAQLAHLAIGQGDLLVTPLHVAALTAAIAADGILMQPRLLKNASPVQLCELFPNDVASEVREQMRAVVVSGTGRAANIPGLTLCGKTGTAQVNSAEDHAWFTCFAPAKKPAIVITVLIENGGFGAAAALPVAKELMRAADQLGYVRGGASR